MLCLLLPTPTDIGDLELCPLLNVNCVNSRFLCQLCHVMWVRKQGGDAVWQELATPAAAIRQGKSEGAPSTLQQVQIERAIKNSKPRNIGAAAAKPSPNPVLTTSHTPSVASRVQVLSPLYCSSSRGRLCRSVMQVSYAG